MARQSRTRKQEGTQSRGRRPRRAAPTCDRPDAAPAAPAEPPATPGAYMRLCRERAGRSIADCVMFLCSRGAGPGFWLTERMTAMEADVPGDYSALLHRLRKHRPFSFSFGHWVELAALTNAPFLQDAGE